MACGEGYGSNVLARSAASVVGVDANPEAHEHARLRYRRPNLRFARDLVETFAEPADAVVFLQTIEHLQDPGAVLAHFRSLVGEQRRACSSPLPTCSRWRPRALSALTIPGTCTSTERRNSRCSAAARSARCEMYGLFHARKLRAHELALKLGWDSVHPRLRLTKPFYDWFTPAIAASDFVLRPAAEADLDKALDFIAVCRP